MPFWDYLDEQEIMSQIYNIPSNFPPSPSKHGYHLSLAGLGTPDIAGGRGRVHHFLEGDPSYAVIEPTVFRTGLIFNNETAMGVLLGPRNLEAVFRDIERRDTFLGGSAQELMDRVCPDIVLEPLSLLLVCQGGFFRSQPPLLPRLKSVHSLRPDLISVSAQRFEIDGFTADRPKPSVAGVIP